MYHIMIRQGRYTAVPQRAVVPHVPVPLLTCAHDIRQVIILTSTGVKSTPLIQQHLSEP